MLLLPPWQWQWYSRSIHILLVSSSSHHTRCWMASKRSCWLKFTPPPPATNQHRRLLSSRRLLLLPHSSSSTPPPPSLRVRLSHASGYSSHAAADLSTPDVDRFENPSAPVVDRLKILKIRMGQLGFDTRIIAAYKPGCEYRMLCPMCKGGDSSEKSLSLYIEPDGNFAVWNCFRAAKCGWKGHMRAHDDEISLNENSTNKVQVKGIRKITKQDLKLQRLSDKKLLKFFADRMISKETLKRNSVMQTQCGNELVIAFPYMRDGVSVSCKYRGDNNRFWQEKDSESILYGLEDIKEANEIIIVEGEMDKLALEEAGFRNCVSVPNGAPPSTSANELPPEDQENKYQYLFNCKEYLDKASRIILATNGDKPGEALAEELARRLGKERCWRVKWPENNEDCLKDANEVLMHLGSDELRQAIEAAVAYPIRGLYEFSDYFDELDAYYHRTIGYELGLSTGWDNLNQFYNVVPGELTIVSGVPNSGKSEWIDALICNLNKSAGWKFALCSMENKVREHGRKLLEKRIKKPFFDVRYGACVERMSAGELEAGKKWLAETFFLIRCEKDILPNIKWVLDTAKAAVLRHGVRGLVIDPYNELDHQRPGNQNETEYVSQMLTMVKRFAQHHSCHVWFVAHPRQLQNYNGSPPNLYDISGSAHFINKCDNGIIVHRNRDAEAGPLDRVQVCVRKVRNKVAGTIGEAYLYYDRVTGEYTEEPKVKK